MMTHWESTTSGVLSATPADIPKIPLCSPSTSSDKMPNSIKLFRIDEPVGLRNVAKLDTEH